MEHFGVCFVSIGDLEAKILTLTLHWWSDILICNSAETVRMALYSLLIALTICACVLVTCSCFDPGVVVFVEHGATTVFDRV